MTAFYPPDAPVPAGLRTEEFVLRPLGEDVAEIDLAAVLASRDLLRVRFGGEWPREGFTLEENREDLRGHAEEFANREAFTYTVLAADEAECLGCLYLYPLAGVLHHFGADEASVDRHRRARRRRRLLDPPRPRRGRPRPPPARRDPALAARRLRLRQPGLPGAGGGRGPDRDPAGRGVGGEGAVSGGGVGGGGVRVGDGSGPHPRPHPEGTRRARERGERNARSLCRPPSREQRIAELRPCNPIGSFGGAGHGRSDGRATGHEPPRWRCHGSPWRGRGAAAPGGARGDARPLPSLSSRAGFA